MRRIRVDWQAGTEHLRESLFARFAGEFPRIAIQAGRCIRPERAAWDPVREQYDAGELLDSLPCCPDEIVLCLVHEDLYVPGFRYLYGAARECRAIVSDIRTGDEDCFYKEALHELGHAAGLSHCRRACVMRTSPTAARLRGKPACFCIDCKRIFLKEMEGEGR